MKTRGTLGFVLGLWLAALGAAPVAPVERDLGEGLVYVRVHRLPADLPAKPAGRVAPCVIDLRYVEAAEDAAAAFSAWLKFRAGPRTPVFVLANGDTAAPLLKVMAPGERGAGVVLIGIESERFRPDVPVKSTSADERRAYDALEQGAAVATLVADQPNKARNDEASLTRERPLDPPAADDKAAPTLIDLTLQRAVHLHRALVAMKKL
ncbi:MAG: hypothetical protein JNL92_12580 [Opitutaceae bacterium]|nr:hypothetical protein [Opitutaceae bacterium]